VSGGDSSRGPSECCAPGSPCLYSSAPAADDRRSGWRYRPCPVAGKTTRSVPAGYTIGAMFFLDARTARVTWTVLVFAAALGLLYLLRKPLLLFVFSLFFAYLLFPLVRMVERGIPRQGGRPLAIGVVYLLLLLAMVGVGLGVGSRLTEEVTLLTEKAPQMSQQIA